MNNRFFSFLILSMSWIINHCWAVSPFTVEITNENLDQKRLPQLILRPAAISSDLHDCAIPTPLKKQSITATYDGLRNSLSLSLADQRPPKGKIVIYLCSASLPGHEKPMPYFSVSDSTEVLKISLRQDKKSGLITAAITTEPPNLAMINSTVDLPLGGIPFAPLGDASSDSETESHS